MNRANRVDRILRAPLDYRSQAGVRKSAEPCPFQRRRLLAMQLSGYFAWKRRLSIGIIQGGLG